MKAFYTTIAMCLAITLGTTVLTAQTLDTSRIMMTELDGQTPISSDDVEQINNEIDKLYDDDLDTGWEGDEFNVATVGMRFREVNVPQGAIIDSAFIEVFAHEDEGDPAFITIWGQDSDDTETFNDTDLVTDRPATDATVRWECTEEWFIWQKYRTPNFATVVQEIVDRDGWTPGNSMVFVLEGEDQGASDEDNARDMESFENVEDPDDGGDGLNHPERIPKLYIYYTVTSSIDEVALEQALKLRSNTISNGQLVLSYDGSLEANMSLHLFSMNGSKISTLTDDLSAGSDQTFYLPDLAKGMYILNAQAGSMQKSYRIFVY